MQLRRSGRSSHYVRFITKCYVSPMTACGKTNSWDQNANHRGASSAQPITACPVNICFISRVTAVWCTGASWDTVWCTGACWDTVWCTGACWNIVWCTGAFWDVVRLTLTVSRRIWYPTEYPSRSARSCATLSATVMAEIRRGWVQMMLATWSAGPFREASRMN